MAKRICLISGILVSVALFLFFAAPKFNQSRSIEIKNNPTADAASVSEFSRLRQLADSDEKSGSDEENGDNKNFLILGAAGAGNDAPDLTDTILVAHFTPTQKRIYLFSLPRDLLVKIPAGGNFTKLNALYAFNKNRAGHEFDLIRQKAEDITGLAIDHYVFIDLATVKNLVDILGGINVLVKKDIFDPAFPGPNHSFQTFILKAGWRYLDGANALKYIRSRYSTAGDFDRIARQQEILQAVKQKILTLNFWDISALLNIYQTVASHIKTDLGIWQIKNFWQGTKSIPGDNIIKNEINDANFLKSGQTILGNETAFILQPKAGLENYDEIKKYIQEIIKK